MPLFSVTIRASELSKTKIKLEDDFTFESLKLLHCYHNIDSTNLADSTEKTGEVMLYARLGNLTDGANLVSFSGDYATPKSFKVQGSYQYDEYKEGQSGSGVASVVTNTGVHGDIKVDHLIPLGASRCNSQNIVTRDLMKTIHDGGIRNWNGEIDWELLYMNKNADIVQLSNTAAVGGLNTSGTGSSKSFLTLIFEYKGTFNQN